MSTPLPAQKSAPPAHKNTVLICMIIAALGIAVWFNYYIKVKQERISPRLPMQSRIEQDILLTDQDGRERRFGELKGKVWVVTWLFTKCSFGCAGLAVEFQSLQKEFGSDPNFALVSVTVDPAEDTPQALKTWTTAQGFTGDNWWFVTGEEKPLAYRLVDAKGNIRGERYYPFSELNGGRYFPRDIREDIRQLLDEAKVQD